MVDKSFVQDTPEEVMNNVKILLQDNIYLEIERLKFLKNDVKGMANIY